MYAILIVGIGSIGERHLRCFMKTGRVNKIGICDINDRRRQHVEEKYNITFSFNNLFEALKEDWSGAVIATPANTHLAIALEVARAGVHLFIEKPLSTNTEHFNLLQDIIDKSNLKSAVAYVYRAHPVLADMRKAILSGKFGDPLQVVAVSGQNFPFYRPNYQETYYVSHSTGGGAIQDALTHVINACEWLVGPIDHIAADAKHMYIGGVEVEDTVHMFARHGNVMGSYSLNQYQAPNEMIYTVVCTEGTLRFELHNNRWMWQREAESNWNISKSHSIDRDEWFTFQENAFLDYLDGLKSPLCSLNEAYQTMKVNLAVLKSTQSKEKFININ
jgi:predicted dehydrogenase